MTTPACGTSRAPAARALLLACHPEPAATVTAIAAALAASTGRPAAGIAAAGAAVAAGQLSVGWHNDWLDAARDRAAGRPDKPVARGSVGRGTVGMAALVALAACVPLSLLSGVAAGAAHLGAVALAWTYNAWLKATPLSWLPYAACFALLVAFVTLGRPGAQLPPAWALGTAAMLGVGAHLANAVPDLGDDRAAGLRSLPELLGERRSVRWAAAVLGAASVLVTFGPGRTGWPALGLPACAALLAAGFAAPRQARSRRLFRVAMAVAVIDVASLVGRGRLL